MKVSKVKYDDDLNLNARFSTLDRAKDLIPTFHVYA